MGDSDRRHECGKAGATSSLLFNGIGKEKLRRDALPDPSFALITQNKWKSWTSWYHESRRTGSVPPLGSTTDMALNVGGAGESVLKGKPALLLVCCVVVWTREGCPPHLPHPLPLYGRQGGWPWIMRVGELAISLTDCNIQESRPCTSPEQHGGPRYGGCW